MKVLIDTNVFLSYLLASATPRAVTAVVTTCFDRDEIDILVPHEQIDELVTTAGAKRYFRRHIPHATLDDFIQQLTALAELPPTLEEIPAYSRDAKDDYLVAYGIVNEADFLITGDADLLVLGRVGTVEVINPSQFIAVLREHNLLSSS